jgi:hypothetical protein
MTEAREIGHQPVHLRRGQPDLRPPMDSRQVCEIVSRVAAEVLSEVHAGTWRPPGTLRIDSWLRGPAPCQDVKSGCAR